MGLLFLSMLEHGSVLISAPPFPSVQLSTLHTKKALPLREALFCVSICCIRSQFWLQRLFHRPHKHGKYQN